MTSRSSTSWSRARASEALKRRQPDSGLSRKGASSSCRVTPPRLAVPARLRPGQDLEALGHRQRVHPRDRRARRPLRRDGRRRGSGARECVAEVLEEGSMFVVPATAFRRDARARSELVMKLARLMGRRRRQQLEKRLMDVVYKNAPSAARRSAPRAQPELRGSGPARHPAADQAEPVGTRQPARREPRDRQPHVLGTSRRKGVIVRVRGRPRHHPGPRRARRAGRLAAARARSSRSPFPRRAGRGLC